MATPDIVQAHRHAGRHRDEVLASERCGCFYCCAEFPPAEIVSWLNEVGVTQLMHERIAFGWFGRFSRH